MSKLTNIHYNTKYFLSPPPTVESLATALGRVNIAATHLQQPERLVEHTLRVGHVVRDGQWRALEVRLQQQVRLRVRAVQRVRTDRQRHALRQLPALCFLQYVNLLLASAQRSPEQSHSYFLCICM